MVSIHDFSIVAFALVMILLARLSTMLETRRQFDSDRFRRESARRLRHPVQSDEDN